MLNELVVLFHCHCLAQWEVRKIDLDQWFGALESCIISQLRTTGGFNLWLAPPCGYSPVGGALHMCMLMLCLLQC